MPDQQAGHEISLGGVRFPITGRVRVTNVAVTPNPIIFGDTTRQSGTEVMSQFVQSSAAGGSGIFKANARTDIDRVWKSRLETRFQNQRSLPPLSWVIGKPSSLTSEDCLLLVEYRNAVYAVFSGGKVFRWSDGAATYLNGVGTGGWSALLQTITSSPIFGSVVYKDFLFIATDTSLFQLSSTDSWRNLAVAAQYLEVWDDKLWRLALETGRWKLHSTLTDPADSTSWPVWVDKTTTFPYGVTPTQLTTFRDVDGLTALCAITNVGLWLYDASNDKWRQTEIRIPELPTGQGSSAVIFRDGKLYFTSGNMGMVSVQPGNPFVAAPVGLDLGDGVPPEDSGKINQITADFNWIIALVDSTGTVSTDTINSGLASPFDTPAWDLVSGNTTLRAWNGSWHCLWESPSVGAPAFSVLVSGAYSKRRVYWGSGGQVYWQGLPTGVHNPRHNPTPEFAVGPFSEQTPWLDLGAPGTDKLLGHVEMYTANCSVDEKITLEYATDFETSWHALNDSSGTNIITTNGLHTFRVGGKNGLKCRFVSFRWTLQRGTDSTKTPIIEYWLLEFMRLLPATYGFTFTLALNNTLGGKTPLQLLETLKAFADPTQTPNMIAFTYQDDLNNRVQTHYGRILRLQGDEESGLDLRGVSAYTVSFVAPYLGDSD